MSVTIRIAINSDPVLNLLATIRQRSSNLTPAMKVIGEVVRTSVIKNFEEEGRPGWKKSKRALKEGGLTLTKSGRLRKSITAKASSDQVEIGTNLIYARIHQLGGEVNHPARERVIHFDQRKRGAMTFGRPGKNVDHFAKPGKARYAMKVGGKAYKIVMPRREFLKIQPEDWTEIQRVLENYLSALG